MKNQKNIYILNKLKCDIRITISIMENEKTKKLSILLITKLQNEFGFYVGFIVMGLKQI